MFPSLAFVLGLTLSVLVKSDYDWSYSAHGGDLEQEECVFKGTVSNANSNLCTTKTISSKHFKQDADLTWKRLTAACPDLIYAGCAESTWGSDKSMTELEWRSCTQCPRCPCNKGEPNNYYINNFTSFTPPFEVKQCKECTCDEWYTTDSNADIYAFDCHTESTFNSPESLLDIQCPFTTTAPTPAPTGGCDDGTGTIYNPGDYFFSYDGDQCETYCRCNDTNGGDCETGWANIMENEELKYQFLDTCKDSLFDAYDDVTRWDSPDSTTTCIQGSVYMNSYYRCPTANCGDNTDGNKWSGLIWNYGVYDDDGSFEKGIYDCVDCNCISGNTAVSCTAYDEEEASEEDCSRDTLLCYSDETGDGDIGDDLDVTTCKAADGQRYCGWSKSQAVEGFDPDKVCIESSAEDDASWGCQPSNLCEALFGTSALEDNPDGICSYNKVSWTAAAYDCINYAFVEETYTVEYNFMCCSEDSCNGQEPTSTALGDGSDACSSNSKFGAYIKGIQESCNGKKKYSKNNDFAKFVECGKSLPDGKYEVCSLLAPYWKYATYCECKNYQMLEKMYPNDDYHDGIRGELQLAFDESKAYTKAVLELWNEGYDCGKTFECDITKDGVNKLSVSFVSVLFVVVMHYWL